MESAELNITALCSLIRVLFDSVRATTTTSLLYLSARLWTFSTRSCRQVPSQDVQPERYKEEIDEMGEMI